MAWLLASEAEIARGAHQSLAKVVTPDAVNDHASGEGILSGRDRLGELEPAAPLCKCLAVLAGQDTQKLARHFRPAVARVSTDQHMGIAWLTGVCKLHDVLVFGLDGARE